ncbi:MAG: deoxyribodipyrimidine photo-lyase [Candidatus Humimicrobiaceae bacterium]
MKVNQKRIRTLREGKIRNGPIAYWISRDQRVNDNWALLYTLQLAQKYNKEAICIFCLTKEFLDSSQIHYAFMLKGLKQLEKNLKSVNIPFYLIVGQPKQAIPELVEKMNISILVTDFDPLKIKRRWKADVLNNTSIPFYEVDTHNIVPCWVASEKQEYAAYTFRPKINEKKVQFLENFPKLVKQQKPSYHKIEWDSIYKRINIRGSALDDLWLQPGEENAFKKLDTFLNRKLKDYNSFRNDPARDIQSNLSPYLHFGHISSQRVALEALSKEPDLNIDAFLEELIVRKELSDNFCYYNQDYDNFNGFPYWAKKTLNTHKRDRRKYNYSLNELENAQTHDLVWNAAQNEMKNKYKMHGYMRMYWAKKILEWTDHPSQAQEFAIYLNNKYELDGRDPNGYAGIAWSIGGVHDRAWKEREIFGKIRYMSQNSLKRKFNLRKYTSTFLS